MKILKSHWLDARRCAAKAWLSLRAPSGPIPESSQFLLDQGREVLLKARELFPGGVEGQTPERTRALMADPAVPAIFDAVIEADPFETTIDILQRLPDGWHLWEVRSSLSTRGNQRRGDSRDLISDLAFSTMVLQRAGLDVARASVALLSRDYRFGDPVRKLFEIVEKSYQVDQRVDEADSNIDHIGQILLGDQAPEPVFCPSCRKCEFFATECLGAGLQHTVLEIPGLRTREIKMLADAGVVDLAQLPDDFPLNERQQRAKECALTGNRYVGRQLGEQLQSVEWPCYYLDFESVMTALPLFPGHGCHRPVLTQFSLHRRPGWEYPPTHSEYLADPTRDCAREFAEALVAGLGWRGSIFVYSEFEGTQIQAMAELYPDLAPALRGIHARLVDLLPIVQRHVYDPAFEGRSTLKKVLPALVPDLSYDGLAIRDGGTAVALFARMAKGEIAGEQAVLVRQQLLEYCRMDTMAMVRLHETLHDLSAQRAAAGQAPREN